MEVITIIYIAIAFVVGVVVTFFFKKGSSSDRTQLSKLNSENEELKLKLSEAEEKAKSLIYNYSSIKLKLSEVEEKAKSADAISSSETDKIKAKYEALLKDTNAQINKLDQQLKSALEGNLDDSIKEQLADAEKLKRKIKDLEDELEDAEDDLSDAKKKLNTKDADIADLQDNLAKEQKTVKKLRDELSSVNQILEDKLAALDFIQEILSAKEISTSDTNKLYKNIDFFESFVKGQFTDLNAYLYTTYKLSWNNIEGKAGFEEKKKYFFNSFDQWASTKRKSWLDGKTTIAFVGEFSAGKTSIVNRILSQDNPNIPQLPVSTKVTTAIPTYIAGGSIVSYSFISGDAKRKTILEDTFKKVSKDILDQVKGVSSLIKYFVMTYKNPNLNGLSILDTPGFNSNDSEDRERTIDVINECDALFWVFDVNAGAVNRSSISIIKEKLNKPLYVVINKVETKPESVVQEVEDFIKKTLADAGLQVQQYIRFSAKAPLASIMDPIKAVNKIATRDTFVYDVKNDLELLLKNLDDAVKISNEKYDNARKEGENITEEFIDCMKALQSDCETAYDIPQWVEHLFSKDRFEMSASEGNNLRNLLEQIADDRIQALATKFDERVEKAGEIQQEWSDLCDLKAAWQKTNDCYEQFKKVSKDI